MEDMTRGPVPEGTDERFRIQELLDTYFPLWWTYEDRVFATEEERPRYTVVVRDQREQDLVEAIKPSYVVVRYVRPYRRAVARRLLADA